MNIELMLFQFFLNFEAQYLEITQLPLNIFNYNITIYCNNYKLY